MTKLKSASTSINMQNTQLVKKNNSLTLQLSMVTEEMRKQITQAIQSHSSIVTNRIRRLRVLREEVVSSQRASLHRSVLGS